MPVAACRRTCLLGGQNPASAVADTVAAKFVVPPVKWNNEDLRNLDDTPKPAGPPNAMWERDWKNPDAHAHHHCPRSLQTPILTPYPDSPPQMPTPLLPHTIPYKHECKPVDAANAATAAQAQEVLTVLLLEGTAIQGCMHRTLLTGVC